MLARSDRHQCIQAAARVMKNTDAVNIDAHCRNGVSGTRRRNKMDRRSNAGTRWRLNGDTGKRCSNQQQDERTQADDLV